MLICVNNRAYECLIVHLESALDNIKMSCCNIVIAVLLISALLIYPAKGYIVDGVNGNDNNDGETINDPFETITRCVEALKNPGDECQIRAGYYHEVVTVTGLEGSKDAPIKIAGYEDERPIWDGTVSLQPNEWNFDPDTGICSAEIDQDIFALFYKNELMTSARWPNAKWSDKTVFDRDYWRPDGCCDDSERGLIVDDALTDVNLDIKGAMAILNVGSFQTWVREVLDHAPGSNNFTYNDDFGDNINFVKQQYYLESKLELLDAPEEWFYDQGTKMLYFIMPDNTQEPNTCPSEDVLRGRTLDNVLEIIDSTDVIVANITFWSSNVIASTNVDSLTFDSLIFEFPSSSHRMLKSEAYPIDTKLDGDNHSFINCTFRGAEGPALRYYGGNMLIHNSEFLFNDWVEQGNLGTIYAADQGYPGEFSQNTMYYNGVAHGLRQVGNKNTSNITMNYIEGQCWGKIQNDGASIHVQVGAQTGIHISHNWVHSSPKKCIRFDGGGTPRCNEYTSGCGGYVGFNVVWNVEDKEIYTKGDNHTVTNNVAWDDNSEDCTICVPSEHGDSPNNQNSVVTNNGASKFQDGGGLIENNYESQDVKAQMMDTANYDFRPVMGGEFTQGSEIIGAYDLITVSGESISTYWIPGRKLFKTSIPIPRDGATVSAERTDVMCQTGYLADKHDFYFGDNFEDVDMAGKEDDAFQMTLNDNENVFPLPNLLPGKEYYWRVDVGRGDYVFKGDIWSFKTN